MNINLYFAICKEYHKFNIKRYKLKFINYYRIISPSAKGRYNIIQIRDNLHKFIKLYKIITNIVKIFIKRYNLQITNSRFKSYLVGISETTRETSLKNKNIKFNEWLAGIIDGDGYLAVTKAGYTSLEITVHINDVKALEFIKHKLGGSIKPRSGVNAFRYRLHNKEGMILLINAINGHIRNSKRLPQLHKVCSILNIPLIKPISLDSNSSWYTGFFDADGTIGYSFKNKYPQLTISVSNKLSNDIEMFQKEFGGSIYYDKGSGGSYKWSIQSKKDIINFYNYIKTHPSRTSKFNKLILIKKYYELIDIKAYKSLEGSSLNKIWLNFERKWNS